MGPTLHGLGNLLQLQYSNLEWSIYHHGKLIKEATEEWQKNKRRGKRACVHAIGAAWGAMQTGVSAAMLRG
jgi:hypothetical protein